MHIPISHIDRGRVAHPHHRVLRLCHPRCSLKALCKGTPITQCCCSIASSRAVKVLCKFLSLRPSPDGSTRTQALSSGHPKPKGTPSDHTDTVLYLYNIVDPSENKACERLLARGHPHHTVLRLCLPPFRLRPGLLVIVRELINFLLNKISSMVEGSSSGSAARAIYCENE
jgi:hypothetical protein